jgi:hypothetical protein
MPFIESDNFGVYVYDRDHPPPHCHVRFFNGEEVVITLPLLNVLHGGKLEKKVRKVLLEHLDELVEEWDRINPNTERKI